MYEDALQGRKTVRKIRIRRINDLFVNVDIKQLVVLCMRFCYYLPHADPDSHLFSDMIVRLISAGDMTDEPFSKPFSDNTAPPAPQWGYEPSMFTARHHPDVSKPCATVMYCVRHCR